MWSSFWTYFKLIALRFAASVRISALKWVQIVFLQISFGILGLPETWIMPGELYEAILCLFFCCKRSPQLHLLFVVFETFHRVSVSR